MASSQPAPIIKKVKKVSGHGHHGGAWKVAYADFVTAMMAFFLLMWLLNATSEDQKRGISNYFGPYGQAEGAGGSGGVLGGLSMQSKGIWADNKTTLSLSAPSVKVENPEVEEKGEEHDASGVSKIDNPPSQDQGAEGTRAPQQSSDSTKAQDRAQNTALKTILEDAETKLFKEAETSLRQAIESSAELKELTKNLLIDKTPEGLRIQIVDQNGLSMFPVGSSEMHENMKRLLELVAKVTEKLPNKITISGHTDSKPYAQTAAYSNWELSADRANASRRILLEAGFPPERIYSVVGKSSTEPLVASDPDSDSNRRISIVLRKKSLDVLKGGIEDRQNPLLSQDIESPEKPPSLQKKSRL